MNDCSLKQLRAFINFSERNTFNKTTVEIVDEGLILGDSGICEDEDGHKYTKPRPGTEALFPADSVIVAISQGPRAVIVSSTTGIDIRENGLVAVDEFGQTTREGVFASGDVVTGAKTVVEAVKVSRKVADAIDRYITEKYPESR